MKEIVVISGKGGTGKTSIAAAFSHIEGSGMLVADCDVDAANMYVILEETRCRSIDFYSGYHALIDAGKCVQCSKCRAVCHFGAISESFRVDEMMCEGCGYCTYV
jgi:MinD superfamily P-loop ATPase